MKNSIKLIFLLLVTIMVFNNCTNQRLMTDYELECNLSYEGLSNCELYFKNNLDKDLKLKSLKFDCGCMEGKSNKDVIKTNDSTKISFVAHFDTDDTVKYRKAYLEFDNNEKIVLNLKLNLNKTMSVIPKKGLLILNYSKLNTLYQKEITIKNLSSKVIKIIHYKSDKSDIEFIIPNSDSILKPFQSKNYFVKYIMRTKQITNANISIQTDDISNKLLKIKCFSHSDI